MARELYRFVTSFQLEFRLRYSRKLVSSFLPPPWSILLPLPLQLHPCFFQASSVFLLPTKYMNTRTPRVPQCLPTPIVRIGTPPHSLSRKRVCTPLPKPKEGKHTSQRVRGCGGPNSDDLRKSLALCLLCTPSPLCLPGSHFLLLSPSSLHPKESVSHRRQAKLHCVLKVTCVQAVRVTNMNLVK